MTFSRLKSRLNARISIAKRLRNVVVWYLLFLMVSSRKHSIEAAGRFSELNKAQFSRLLRNHPETACYTLDELSKKQAKRLSKALNWLSNQKLPWKIAVLIDATIQHRSSLRTDNDQRFNHGKGLVIGHQWTNIVLLINDTIIPLPPIPFYSKKYCRNNGLEYATEHQRVVEYITQLQLREYIGSHNPKEVVVLADSGYDDKKIETAIVGKKWQFIIALCHTRSVKSDKQYANSPKSRGWRQVSAFFKCHRRLKWKTVRLQTNRTKRKRMDFRIRDIIAHLRYVGKVRLVCSEFRKRPEGRRKYLACNDLKASPRQILIGYRIRWKIEIFHKEVKMFFGFEDVAAKWFESVMAHVHWVYCAYILLHSLSPGPPELSVPEKQRRLKTVIDNREKSRVLQLLTQFDGPQRHKDELREALSTSC